jgi:4-hydroxy-2-oxoheptanedioate aldolase
MRPNPVKQLLRAGKPAVGTWLSLGSVTAARFMARAGFAWLTVDTEHTATGTETAAQMFAAIADAGCVALCRVLANRHDHIKRALDTGAMGIVVPMVNTREEAEAAVAACKYPPRGTRSVGGGVHALNFGATAADYFARVDEELLIVLQCESFTAVEHADEIFSVPGIDAIFVGPNDLEANMRSADGKPPTAEATADAMKRILTACRQHKVAAGVHCFSATSARQRIEEGWQFLAVNSELRMMTDGAAATVSAVLGERAATVGAKY